MYFNLIYRLFLILFIAFSFMFFQVSESHAEDKYHPLEKYRVEYNSKGFFTGNKTFCSRDWGKEVVEYKLGKVITQEGKTKVENKKVITKVEGDTQWIITIDLDTNTGQKLKNPMYAQMKEFMKGKSPEELKTKMLEGMGGKIVGKKEVAGLECTVWNLEVIDTCITEDSLNLENSSPSNDIYEVATKVEKDKTCSDEEFSTGDAVIEEIEALKPKSNG